VSVIKSGDEDVVARSTAITTNNSRGEGTRVLASTHRRRRFADTVAIAAVAIATTTATMGILEHFRIMD